MTEPWMQPELFFFSFLAVAAFLLGLGQLLSGPRTTLWGGILLCLFGAAAAGCQQPALIWASPLGLGAVVLGLRLLGTAWFQRFAVLALRLSQSSRVQGGALVLASPMLVLALLNWYDNQFEEIALDNDALQKMVQLESHVDGSGLEVVPSTEGVTDLGRIVPLHQLQAEAFLPVESLLTKEAMLYAPETGLKGIQTAPINQGFNCHGWVFANGQCWIMGQHVDTILKDNGYRQVSVPQVGDVAIYRDDKNVVLHTSIVRVADRDGRIIVEGKNGRMGRYLHPPEQQAYTSLACTYYRTQRASHCIQFRKSNSTDSPGGQVSPAPQLLSSTNG